MYRGGNKGLIVLLSRTQAGPGRTVKQEQEEISGNHVQTFISPLCNGGFFEGLLMVTRVVNFWLLPDRRFTGKLPVKNF